MEVKQEEQVLLINLYETPISVLIKGETSAYETLGIYFGCRRKEFCEILHFLSSVLIYMLLNST